MNESSFFSLEAGQRFISSETQEFLNSVIFGLPNWKWLSLFAIIIVLYFTRILIFGLIVRLKKTQNYFQPSTFMKHFLDQEIERGLSWVIISTIALVLIDSLNLPLHIGKYIELTIKVFLSFNLIRACYLAAEAIGLSIENIARGTQTQLNGQLAPFATKTLKVLVIIVGSLIVLQNFGVNVTALLAGLGIGGVALAFAAQDTVANVFGTITILLDSPFKLGDQVKIGDTEGIVEEIGFRSTHIKTPYNSSVIIPNSVVAKEKIDNLTKRDNWIRFRHVIGFTYSATPDLIQSFSENLKYQLLQNPTVDRERIAIHLNSFGDYALNVIVNFHYRLKYDEIDLAKTAEFLKLVYAVAEQHKLSFAYPTQSLILQKDL